MRARHLLVFLLALCGTADIAQAAIDYPRNTVGAMAIKPSSELTRFAANFANLSDEQLQQQIDAANAELLRRRQARVFAAASKGQPKPGPQAKPTQSAKGDTAHFQKIYLRELGYPNEAAAAPPKPPIVDPCNPQRLYIRQNSLDNYLYGVTPASKAKGAQVSYTDDRLAGTQSATINGMVSYVVLRDLCPVTPPGDSPFLSAYLVAPFVLGQGNYTEPHAKTERSALQFGAENQIEISRWIIPRQVFTIAPYFQTDYRDEARAGGAKAYWDLYDPDLHLGGYLDTDPYLGWFIQIRGEADALKVGSVGVTNLAKTDYEWFGGTAALNVFFLPADTNVPDIIRNRFAFYATASYFTDAHSGMNIHYYTAKLAYKITSDGSSSIAVEYDDGTQQSTLVAAKQYLVSLSYAY